MEKEAEKEKEKEKEEEKPTASKKAKVRLTTETHPLTKYEQIRVVGMRAEQLRRGAQPYVDVDARHSDPCEIAERELEARRLPLKVERTLPNGKKQTIHITF